MRTIAGVVAAAAAASALAQGPGGWVISVNYGPGQSSVNPANPTCRVRISATHHPGDYAVAGVRFDALAGESGWASPSPSDILAPLTTGSNPGSNVGPNRMGIIAGQLSGPVWGPPDPRSPIGVWEVAWTTANFTPRTVPLATRTIRFDVYPDRNSPVSTSRLQGLVEGAGGIIVTPAPAAAASLGAAGVCIARRRRRDKP